MKLAEGSTPGAFIRPSLDRLPLLLVLTGLTLASSACPARADRNDSAMALALMAGPTASRPGAFCGGHKVDSATNAINLGTVVGSCNNASASQCSDYGDGWTEPRPRFGP